MINVEILEHPLVSHHLSIIRDRRTSADLFRNSIRKISEFLLMEATRNLPLRKTTLETPLSKMEVEIIDDSRTIFVSAVMRAGAIMLEAAASLIPGAVLQHLGIYRDEETSRPVWYYNRLPAEFKKPEDTLLYICDPMLATGGTATEAIKMYLKRGLKEKNITFVCVIAAPEGVNKLSADFPNIKIRTAAVDEKLNNKNYIVPGLGDAGDRIFNTLY
ncbi:MAG: uracil phosphoribosyltransferase [Rickettsiales bacterium]|jgi:uracil phosphoribosyltransferase|nr:uracil phosphoribosyltransferase [Rickettsiales bacterium]